MKRRLVVLTCLLGIVGGGAAVASAATGPVKTDNHNVCLVFANSDNYHNTSDLCVTVP